MQFANYLDFRAKFQQMFDGDDISASDISVAVLDLMIGAGEQRIYRQVRSSAQEASFALPSTSSAIPVPADFIELRQAPNVPNYVQSIYVPPEAFQNVNALYPRNRNHPIYYTVLADQMLFYPSLPDGTIVNGTYYKRFADISTGLNAFFTRWPDLFLYASLSESAPFLGELTRLPVWEAKFTELVSSVNETERRRISRGGKLQTRAA